MYRRGGSEKAPGAESSKVLGFIPGQPLTCLFYSIRKGKLSYSVAEPSVRWLRLFQKKVCFSWESKKAKTVLHSWTDMAFHVTECNFSFFCFTVVTAQAERLADQMTSLRHRYALWPSALGQFRGYIRTPTSTASVRRITLHQGKESYCEISSAAGPITNNTSFLWGIK